MENKGQKSFSSRENLKKMNNGCLSKSPRTQFEHWTSSIHHFFAISIFCWIHTYLVNVLQFVNNLTDHWLRALHFQLMEVELIFHSISCCLLAVSGKHEGKEKVCHKRVPSKVQVDCIWHQWSSWPQALFSLPTHGMTAWYKGRPLQIGSICSREHSTVNKYSFNILFF